MSVQRTLAIIKPDVVEKRQQGVVLQRILDEGFRVLAMRQARLSRQAVEGFYAVHRGKPFFDELCDFMSRGPVVLLALERENAVAHWRGVIGATNPANAAPGTIRKGLGTRVGDAAVPGPHSDENGGRERG